MLWFLLFLCKNFLIRRKQTSKKITKVLDIFSTPWYIIICLNKICWQCKGLYPNTRYCQKTYTKRRSNVNDSYIIINLLFDSFGNLIHTFLTVFPSRKFSSKKNKNSTWLLEKDCCVFLFVINYWKQHWYDTLTYTQKQWILTGKFNKR